MQPRPGHRPARPVPTCLALFAASCASVPLPAPAPAQEALQRQEPFVVRPFRPLLGERWIGNGIAYGMHRDGQSPDGAQPTRAQLHEDLILLAQRFHLLRLYNASATAEVVLQIARDEKLPFRFLLGLWVAPETDAKAHAANRAELEGGVRLANAFPGQVIALEIGNETQISWSDHRVPTELLIGYLREARARTVVPVTTADDFAYWSAPESVRLAAELDFIDMHAYAMWAGEQLENALRFTQEKYAAVVQHHPDRIIILGEHGWATKRHSEGEQAKLIRGQPGEEQQAAYRESALTWTTRERIANVYFEAFDENWKGGAHPDEVEKHWGLYRADRTPKQAVRAASF